MGMLFLAFGWGNWDDPPLKNNPVSHNPQFFGNFCWESLRSNFSWAGESAERVKEGETVGGVPAASESRRLIIVFKTSFYLII